MATARTTSRGIRRVSRHAWVSVVALCGTLNQAAAQTPVEVTTARQAAVVARQAQQAALEVAAQAGIVSYDFRDQSVPQDVLIMRTIVRTALSQVEPPDIPEELGGDSATASLFSEGRRFLYASGRVASFGGSDVSGFYMQGYGYLFTVHWSVSSLAPLRTPEVAIALAGRERVPGVAEPDSRAQAAREWASQYRSLLADALRDVIAGYGSTLQRAQPGESITFIADFGGGDDQMVTMTTKVDALHGSDVETNRNAIEVSTGQSGTSARLRTQLEIMSQIIDTSLRSSASDREVYGLSGTYFGGSANPQYVPGYGVIFRKNARMSTTRTFADLPGAVSTLSIVQSGGNPSPAVDSVRAKALEMYRAHLDTLRQKTAGLLADYGPTLTELGDEDWVGLYYDVGSAAALLNSGLGDYLVQARMRDIREAANQTDPAQWLMARLVTNEKEE